MISWYHLNDWTTEIAQGSQKKIERLLETIDGHLLLYLFGVFWGPCRISPVCCSHDCNDPSHCRCGICESIAGPEYIEMKAGQPMKFMKVWQEQHFEYPHISTVQESSIIISESIHSSHFIMENYHGLSIGYPHSHGESQGINHGSASCTGLPGASAGAEDETGVPQGDRVRNFWT